MSCLKVIAWIKKYWQILVGAVIALGSFLTYYLQSKNLKKVLQKANESHAKENEINDDARESLVQGLDKIREKSTQDIIDFQKEKSKKEKALEKEKKDFIENQKNSKDLAKDIADSIGADFVETDEK